MMTWYNPELPFEEKNRRLNTLTEEVVDRTIAYLRWLRQVPWPQSWHIDKEVNHFNDAKLTDEEWDSLVENRPVALDAIQKIPELHLQRRCLMAPEFWRQQREAWRAEYVRELELLRKDTEFSGTLWRAKMDLSHKEEEIERAQTGAWIEELTFQIQEEKVKRDNVI
jgi:hypothetical protein